MSDDITQRTFAVIAQYAEADVGEITRQTEINELGITSLGLTEIVMELEDIYDIEIDMNTAEAWESISNAGQIADAVNALVKAQS